MPAPRPAPARARRPGTPRPAGPSAGHLRHTLRRPRFRPAYTRSHQVGEAGIRTNTRPALTPPLTRSRPWPHARSVDEVAQTGRPAFELHLRGRSGVDEPRKQQRMVGAGRQSRVGGHGGGDAGLGEPWQHGRTVNPARITEVRQAGRIQSALRETAPVVLDLANKEIALLGHPVAVGVELHIDDPRIERAYLL